jgi:hypothetical protein
MAWTVWWPSHRPGSVGRFGDRGLPKHQLPPGLLLQQGQEPPDTRPTPPPSRTKIYPEGISIHRIGPGRLGDHWSRRLLADQPGRHSTVARVWAEHDGKPWQTEAFRFASDPELEARVRDVVGLSLEPSAHAIVRWVDERSQIQALERTRLPAPASALPAGGIGAEPRLTRGG